MCLAIPGKIESIEDNPSQMRMGRVNMGGIFKQVNLELVPEAKVHDYVLIHVGVALSIVDEEEAQKTLDFLRGTDDFNELFDDMKK